MDNKNIREIVAKQRAFFSKGETLSTEFRIEQLRKLKMMVTENETAMTEALKKDLGRHFVEAYFCDVGTIILEINETIKGLRKWSKPETHFSGFTCFPSLITKVYKQPYGVTLIISPFNFPFLLSLGVLIASIAGGNTAIIKASSKSVNCTALLEKMVKETFPEEYVTLLSGGHDVAEACLTERFDKIFYTGSPKVGKHVLEMAARNLTPVALELGGENGNWCVVRKDANIKDAARKIAFFKMCNSGQICININQVAVAEEVAEEFIREFKASVEKMVGDPLINEEYPKLISPEAYKKCAEEAEEYKDRIVFGGEGVEEDLKYSPTLIYPVRMEEKIVKHELFNPLLPIVPFKDEDADKVMEEIAAREHGLSLYIFTKNIKWAKKVMKSQQYGGGCVNEVCLHLMVKGAPFNGTGHSGMGAYHGKWGFNEFTHPSTVLYGKTHFNLSLREHPYAGKEKGKMKLLRFFEK
ncbi:MAG: aldehyde dehydrogenase family protein [Lachnospiraceae bacterium]|nr:aldehyde dehydrogenase family protein [Lachnospiraceae bacterium]